MPVPAVVASTVDALLEATVVGSFSSIGPGVRRRLEGWIDAAPPGSLAGRTALVTGATSGLGRATAQLLARAGADVIVVGRDRVRAEQVVADLRATAPGTEVRHHLADVGDQRSVRELADAVAADVDRLDVLVHAAGALLAERHEAPDGTEQTVATHVLGPHLLTRLLLPQLRAAAPGRVVWVTSGGMYSQRLDLERLDAGPEGYDGTAAYARAKRAQVVLVEAWAARTSPHEVVVDAMHPGWADTPGVVDALPRFHRLLGPILRTPEQGAETIAWLVGPSRPAGEGGELWLDRRRRSHHRVPWTIGGATADELWAWCEARTQP